MSDAATLRTMHLLHVPVEVALLIAAVRTKGTLVRLLAAVSHVMNLQLGLEAALF